MQELKVKASNEIIEELGLDAVVRGFCDPADKKTSNETLIFALALEAANQASQKTHYARKLRTVEYDDEDH